MYHLLIFLKLLNQMNDIFKKNNIENPLQKKRKLGQNKFIKDKRDRQRIDDCYAFVKHQQAQDSRELSKSNHLTNESYRSWNYSAYSYNPSKRQYEFDSTLGHSADVPKYLKER